MGGFYDGLFGVFFNNSKGYFMEGLQPIDEVLEAIFNEHKDNATGVIRRRYEKGELLETGKANLVRRFKNDFEVVMFVRRKRETADIN